jgi:hypothetical protein
MHRLFHVGWAIALLAAAAPQARADGEPDGPKRIFRDEFIENLVGKWNITRQIRGREARNTLTAEWVLNHQFLELHMKDVAEPPTYEAVVLIGYSYDDRRYVIHWCDTYGGKFSSMGYGRRSKDGIEFEFPDPENPFFNTFTWDAAGKKWVFRMENGRKDGTRTLFAVDTLQRP